MSEDVKTRILDAAKRLFADKGFEATSVRQICEEAGANVALVSYHFGGKEKLLFAVLDSAFPGQELYAEIEGIADPVERLRRYVEGFMLWSQQESDVQKILMQEIMLKSDRHHLLGQYPLPFWQRLRDTLAEGREHGLFSFQSLKAAMLQMMGTLLYPKMVPQFVLDLFDPEEVTFEEQIRETQQYILRGLGANTTESERGSG
ncbi:TetR family transcriptional regulator [Tumebacillus sp. BK434]|uniref:TetR/AcrR family transcriptional regulator n=1 Tax=Tumebacillus sp. BK434 TaxID=2512169 RepID=UPI0010530FC4|nr:TetR family transcriptional regulator [Tumebacillus sp. BK434]TCP53801.1 TetR family transcriptional regulator [Tumebacillus sp. BK434]